MAKPALLTFQEALEVVESLPEDQQENLIDIVRRRRIEHRRDVLAEQIKEARSEYERGEVRRGTVDELWESVAGQPEALPLTVAQAHELDRRLAVYQGDRSAGVPWREALDEIEQSGE